MRCRGDRARAAGRRRGAVTVLVAISMVLLLGVLALVLDGGLMLIERRRAQAAADAAALAATYALVAGDDDATAARTAALSFAAANGFTDGSGATVTVNIPPESGAFAGADDCVEVIVASETPRCFSAIWEAGDLEVGARAVAKGGTPSTASLILLDPSRSGALDLQGSGRVVTDAGIQVNSTSASAVTATNTGHTRPATSGKSGAPLIKIGGGYATSSGGYLTGKLLTGSPAVSDPLADLPVPPESGTVYNGLPFPPYGTRTMSPGVYNGGVSLGGGMNVTMESGIYYMKGGDFVVANGVTLTGNGVMIYTDTGRFSFQGGGRITLTPPTDGDFAGITLYQDRNSTKDISIANGSTTTITGTIYAAAARVSFAGGASYNQYGTRFIARSMSITNNACVGVGGDSSGGTPSFHLVE